MSKIAATNADFIFQQFSTHLEHRDLVEISAMLDGLRHHHAGKDGAGLSTGAMCEGAIMETLAHAIPGVSSQNVGEADGGCYDPADGSTVCWSLKTGNDRKGKVALALDWSKNKKQSVRERFTCPIVVSIRASACWWKRPMHNGKAQDNKVVSAGIYVVDHLWCKRHIEEHLAKNNKTNTLIKPVFVLQMLRSAKAAGRFIPYPDHSVRYLLPKFSIRRAFGLPE
jgi:hypothetical protein